ncbi:MAG: polyhydroxyalkanoate synthesis repressor PhaR, partial [Gammaproteobacteria bacterium]|nr:polyhydroxyalkanoate synthesis repressor PhaR [Gammaproteobacteria bacterium]
MSDVESSTTEQGAGVIVRRPFLLTEQHAMSDVRLLKKHANRRLYDTEVKKYVSIEEIRDLINAGTDVKIEDSKTGHDITRPILLQIMAECEQNDRPMLSPDMLMALIRHYGHPMQDFVGPYLENSLTFYMRQEARLRQRMTGLFEARDGKK